MVLIQRGDRTVPVTVQRRAHVSPASAFATVVPIDLPLVFERWGPFPGVEGVRDQTGPWDRVGASRSPVLTDGSSATETLTEYVDGASFAYELTGFTNVLGRLVHGVRGEWTFTPDGTSTMIRWTYEFKPRVGRFALVRGGLAPLWSRYMSRGLAGAVDETEKQDG